MAIVTVGDLKRKTQTKVDLTPEAQESLGLPSVTIRRIPPSTFRALFPQIPDAILAGIPKGLTGREFDAALGEQERKYLATAPGPECRRYRVELEAVKFAAVALALVEPKMTEEEVFERLGDEALPVYIRLLEISGLVEKKRALDPAEQFAEDTAEPVSEGVAA